MSKFGVVCKTSHFPRLTIKNANLTLSRFACKSNWNSELGFETPSGLASTLQIQWLSHIWQINFC